MRKVLPPNAILLPENAGKVFAGVIFDVYQWSQKMFDDSTKTFEMLKRPDTLQVIAVHDNKVVILEEHQPGRPMQVHLPGGRAEETDRDWLEGARRELKEETGLTFKSWKLVLVQQPLAKVEWFTPLFLATDLDQELEQEAEADGEKIAVMLKSFEDARKEILSGNYPMMSYLVPLFTHVDSLEQFLSLPEFKGEEVDR